MVRLRIHLAWRFSTPRTVPGKLKGCFRRAVCARVLTFTDYLVVSGHEELIELNALHQMAPGCAYKGGLSVAYGLTSTINTTSL